VNIYLKNAKYNEISHYQAINIELRGCIITFEYIIPDESAGWRRRSGTEDRRDELSEVNP